MRSVNKICEAIRASGNLDRFPNKFCNQVYRLVHNADRYSIDFATDFTAEGWLQFDTSQDAHYFGVWVNPKTRTTLTYCEGDWILVDCLNDDTYNAEIKHACEFYADGFVLKAIDAAGNLETLVQDRAMFFILTGGVS